jgi:multidrug resistance efflux pump
MAKGRFTKIKGTKDFLVLAVVCGFVCLWAIRDAWFPTEKILKKHPQVFPITVAVSGVVQTIPVEVGDEVKGNEPLITLSAQHYEKAVATAEAAYKEVATTTDKEQIRSKLAALVEAKENLRNTTVTCMDFMLETSHGEDPLHGKVLEILAELATHVDAGQTVMLVEPADTFYAFNKTLSVLSFFGMIVGLFFHRIASK